LANIVWSWKLKLQKALRITYDKLMCETVCDLAIMMARLVILQVM